MSWVMRISPPSLDMYFRDWDIVITVTECKLHCHCFSISIYVVMCLLGEVCIVCANMQRKHKDSSDMCIPLFIL